VSTATDLGGSIGEMTMGNTAPDSWLSSYTHPLPQSTCYKQSNWTSELLAPMNMLP